MWLVAPLSMQRSSWVINSNSGNAAAVQMQWDKIPFHSGAIAQKGEFPCSNIKYIKELRQSLCSQLAAFTFCKCACECVVITQRKHFPWNEEKKRKKRLVLLWLKSYIIFLFCPELDQDFILSCIPSTRSKSNIFEWNYISPYFSMLKWQTLFKRLTCGNDLLYLQTHYTCNTEDNIILGLFAFQEG